MKPLSEMVVLVKDSGGLGIEHAVAMGKAVKECIYFNTWQDGFCESKKYFMGRGFENIKKTLYFDDEVDRADLIMYPDIGYGDNAARFRKEGKVVFGAGDAEKFENHRFAFRALQKKIGLYPAPYKTYQAKGIDDLISYLQKHPKQYVKVDNAFRGDCESFPADTYESVKSHIDYLRVKFGPFSDVLPFVVEDMIDSKAEIGIDGFFSGELIRPSLWGIEAGKCYLGRFDQVVPPALEDCISKLGPELKKRNYRGAISTENRMLSKDKSVMIDPTCRFPFNLSVGYTEWFKNYAELVYKVANGEPVTIQPKAKYVGGAPLYFSCEEEWVEINFPKSLRDEGKIKFRECAKKGGKYYAIRGCNSAAFIISWGNSIEQVFNDIKASVEKVNATDINKVFVKNLEDEIMPQVLAIRKMGIIF
jgi:hypothetical protein